MTAPAAPAAAAGPAAPQVLVAGEALVDVVRRPDGSVAELPGGSAANVALTLGRLGRAPWLATWLGPDERGDAVRRWLAGSGVALAPGSDGAARTSLAQAVLDERGSATYTFDLTWELPARVAPPSAVLHVGSIGAELEPGATQVRALVDAARGTATVTYDPNLRPALIGPPEHVRPRVEALVARADVVKVSDEDLGWLLPGADPADVARHWRTLGPALVVVTLGGDGALAVHAGGETRCAAPRIAVADTVGAGDSFMGALIDGLLREELAGAEGRDRLHAVGGTTVSRLLERCVQVAAITCTRPGANPPWAAELGSTGPTAG